MKKIFAVSMLSLLLISNGSVLASEKAISEKHMGEETIFEDSTMELSFVREDKPTTRAEDGAMDGGWWYRGKNGNRLVSEYKHYTKQGHGSCRNGNGTYNSGGWKQKNVWSKSSVGYTILGGNKVYYDNK